MNASDQHKLSSIIDKQLTNEPLSEREVADLESLLQDERCMKFYLHCMEIEANMEDAIETADIKNLVLLGNQPRIDWKWLVSISGIAACLAFFAGWMTKPANLPTSEQTITAVADSPSQTVSNHATITGMVGVRWNTDHPAGLTDNVIAIESGLIELTYESGVQVTIEAPAHYTVLDHDHGKLDYGKLVANVPKGEEGFSIDYPMGKIVDLGTEFGVDLSKGGDISVGVFKGEVELHPNDSKEVSLIQANDAILQTSDNPASLSSIPFDRSKFVRQVPSRTFSWSVSSGDSAELVFDVTHLIWKPSDYRAVIKWMGGAEALNITETSLWRNGQLVSKDQHEGVTSHMKATKNNTYNLNLSQENYKKGTWLLKVKYKPMLADLTDADGRASTTHGVLLLEEGLAYKATREDFIGSWSYNYNGATWERRVLENGKIELYRNSKRRPGFEQSNWHVKDGVMLVWIPHRNAFEDHLLRDANTMIFIDQPYRNAVKNKSEK